jgi:glycosyltransferase
MKLSLITVTFNSAVTLRDTINTVRCQKVEDLEYIVIDGGSSDETLKLLSESEDVVSRWISEPDKGIYDAMNKGVKLATGDVIGFLHADDRFSCDTILKQVIHQFSSGNVDFLYGDLEYISTSQPHKVLRYWQSGVFSTSRLKWGWMPPHPTVYFKKNLLDKIGLFDTTYSIAADYEWMLRCLSQPGLKVFYLPQVMVQMRVGGVSNRSFGGVIKKSREDYRAIKSNNIGGLFTLIFKNLGKVTQFFKKVSVTV